MRHLSCRRLLAFVLAAAMILSLVPHAVYAEENILSFQVEFYANDTYTTVYTKSERAAQHEKIVLEEPRQAEKVKITTPDADGGTLNWVNVGIIEAELYCIEHAELTP